MSILKKLSALKRRKRRCKEMIDKNKDIEIRRNATMFYVKAFEEETEIKAKQRRQKN